MSEESKIRHFTRGIHDEKYDNIKSSIAANESLNTFNKVSEVFITHNNTLKARNGHADRPRLNVAALKTGKSKTGNRAATDKKIGPAEDKFDSRKDYSKFAVPDRYYKCDEWNNDLKANERNFLRSKAKKKRKDSPASSSDSQAALIKVLKTQQRAIKSLTATVQSLKADEDVNDVNMDDVFDNEASTSNNEKKKKKKKGTRIPRKKR